MNTSELQDLASELGEPTYRGKQLVQWIYSKAEPEVQNMKDLPAPFRESLARDFQTNPLTIAKHLTASDGVQKLLVHGGDDEVFECVLLPFGDRTSCCLSSQVGCPMGCTFCATGIGGYDRNLTVGEIVGQYLLLQRLSPKRIGHVVFMGMGEPMLNLDEVLKAIKLLQNEVGLSLRHITVSTVGLVPQIKKLAELKLPIHLALSLHSPYDDVRDRLMPVNTKWPVREVVGAMKEYAKKTGRKVTYEYLLIEKVNDTPDQADALASLVKGAPCVVNLIPFNTVVTEQGFKRPNRQRIQAFRRRLEAAGANVTERAEKGHDIAAACGQLAGQHSGKFSRRNNTSELRVIS